MCEIMSEYVEVNSFHQIMNMERVPTPNSQLVEEKKMGNCKRELVIFKSQFHNR